MAHDDPAASSAVDHAQVTSIQTGPAGQMGMAGQIRRLRISYDKAESGAPVAGGEVSAPNPEAQAMIHSMGSTSVRSASIAGFAAD